MTKDSKLVILATGVNAVGHLNGCSGTALAFLRRGHRVVYLLEEAFAGRLLPLGFEEHHYRVAKPKGSTKPGEKLANNLLKVGLIGPEDSLQKTRNTLNYFNSEDYHEQQITLNRGVEEAIQKYQPDLIIFDANALMPAIYYSGIPWIKNVSMTPIFYEIDDELPPGGSGLPTEGDRTQWPIFNLIRYNFINSPFYNDLVEHKMGYPRFPGDWKSPNSQLLTVYAYPDELNYPTIRNRKDWFNLEVFHKPTLNQKDTNLSELIPLEFIENQLDGKFTGKYILLSMGSMGSIDLELMSRLIETLSKTDHKYIVSKGPRHTEYSLPENMWGARFLPQLELLPHMSLVITHGGNNTVTETFAHGVPMLVLPLFMDQFDNAQRLQETKLGARLDTYRFTPSELISTIDKLLHDDELHQQLQTAAKRIQLGNRYEELAMKVEQLLKQK